MTTLQQFKEEQMKDTAFREAYENLKPEMNRINDTADAENSHHMAHKQPAETNGHSSYRTIRN